MTSIRDQIYFVLHSRVHAMPRLFVRQWQFWELKRLIQLAYARVLFYKKLWDEHGVHPEDIGTLADICKLPITSKQMLKQYPQEEMMIKSFPAGDYKWVTTSGSTGEPFCFPVSKSDEFSRDHVFYVYRFLMWRGTKLDYLMKNLRVARISLARILDAQEPRDRYLLISRELFRDSPPKMLRRLKEFNPDIITGRPTTLFELARIVERSGVRERPRFRYLLSHGEMLYPEVRRFIEGVTGGEVYDTYGLEEVGAIGVECAEHNGLHLNEESLVVEIVDNGGEALLPGNIGRVIVTRFRFNDVMPFIRYDTGDRGMIMEEPCPCGIQARRIKVFGREGIYIALGAKNYHLREFEKIFEKLTLSIFRYQIVKTGRDLLEVRIIPTQRFSSVDENYIHVQFKERFDFTPKVWIVSHLEYNPGGKTPHFIDETKFTR